ncbi:hypothetical protein HGRIS_001071 [Hohenbuehelia grisea]|uniref:Uncharacterized protein n=1 Tax=Hohenbuehelia grisea TaxID=104357 RepID=A0ABR3JPI8_9AGAR
MAPQRNLPPHLARPIPDHVVYSTVQLTASSPINATLVHDLHARLKDRFFLGDIICVDLGNEICYGIISKVDISFDCDTAAGHAFKLERNPHRYGNLAITLEEANRMDDPRRYLYHIDVLGKESSPTSVFVFADRLSRDFGFLMETIKAIVQRLQPGSFRSANRHGVLPLQQVAWLGPQDLPNRFRSLPTSGVSSPAHSCHANLGSRSRISGSGPGTTEDTSDTEPRKA